MSDDDLFGSSGEDTDDLIAASKPPAAKKKRLQKKTVSSSKRKRDDEDDIPNADDDDDDSDGPGLFDDSDDEAPPPKKKLSKKEKMEALRAKRQKDSGAPGEAKKEDGYDSGDSYNSAEYVRTKEDNDFIDVDDDDPDAINELYAEQTFHDERPDGSDDEDGKKKKKKKAGKAKSRGPDALSDTEEGEVNPIMAAVQKMKKKKRAPKKLDELEEEARVFIGKMEQAAQDDEEAIRERRPGTNKLVMLPEVLDMLARRDMQRILVETDLLVVSKRWIQPLPNGTLGNVTVRSQLLDAISKIPLTSHDLKQSEFGKVVMTLYMHKSETPTMKRKLKALIEQWSRPIFQKSGNMRDLEHVQASRRQAGMAAAAAAAARPTPQSRSSSSTHHDLQTMISTGSRGAGSASKEGDRVRVPFSKGFQFTVRPQGKTGSVADKRLQQKSPSKDARGNLNKRMLEKGRVSSKNQRSANISIEGRPTK